MTSPHLRLSVFANLLARKITKIADLMMADSLVFAAILALIVSGWALFAGWADGESAVEHLRRLTTCWSGDETVWKLLAFGMQMSLVLASGYALADAAFVQRIVTRLAQAPRAHSSAIAVVALVSSLAGLLNWGLGVIVGAVLARETARALSSKNIPVNYSLLCAAGFMSLLVWHGGLSGSAPLMMTTPERAKTILTEAAQRTIGPTGIPLRATLLSDLNLFVTLGLILIIVAVFYVLGLESPRTGDGAVRELDAPLPIQKEEDSRTRLVRNLEGSKIIGIALGLLCLASVAVAIGTLRFNRIGINEINLLVISLGLLAHGSLASYAKSFVKAVPSCSGIMLQFPIYGGIAATMAQFGIVDSISHAICSIGPASLLPFLSFLAATFVGLFVPSGGGQWAVQGPVALHAAAASGVPLGDMVMSVAYGDELANMIQPFWFIPLIAVTGANVNRVLGYTVLLMIVAGCWMGLGLLLFGG